MPAKGNKMKSHKASRRRLRVTRNGKILRTQGGVRHFMTHRTPKRKRNLRQKATLLNKALVKRFALRSLQRLKLCDFRLASLFAQPFCFSAQTFPSRSTGISPVYRCRCSNVQGKNILPLRGNCYARYKWCSSSSGEKTYS